ncbi:hypothetical protein EV175_006070, partial [Coemansia sp. RSA 1933]
QQQQQQAYQGSPSFQHPQQQMQTHHLGSGGDQNMMSGPSGSQQYLQHQQQQLPASISPMQPPAPAQVAVPAHYQPYSSLDGSGVSAPMHSAPGTGHYASSYGNLVAQGPGGGAPMQQQQHGYYQQPQQQYGGQPLPPQQQQHSNQTTLTSGPQGHPGAPPPVGAQYQPQPIQPGYGQQISSGLPPLNGMAYNGQSYSSQPPPPALQNAPPPLPHVSSSQQGYGQPMGYPPHQPMQHLPPMQQQPPPPPPQQQQQGYQHGYGGNVNSLMD